MPPQTRTAQTRKTTDIVISPEEWTPVATWLHRCSQNGIPGTRLGLDDETRTAIQKVTTRAARMRPTANIRLRLPNDLADALAQQARFWESCMDELPQAAQEDAPNSMTFMELALDLEASIRESSQPPKPKRPTPLCHLCHKPVEAEGHASVDIVDGITAALYMHNDCTIPE